MKRFVERSASVGIGLILIMSAVLAAQGRTAPALAAAHRESSARTGGDGIAVHGHWTIDVRNPDGKLASHHEFENALEPSGAIALAGLLGRQFQAATWRLDLVGQNASGACVQTSGGGSQYSAFIIGLAPLTFDATAQTWTSGIATPGAPTFSAGSIQVISFTPGDSLAFNETAFDAEGDPITLTQGGGGNVPGFSIVGSGPWTFNFNSSGVAPGTYGTSLTLSDGQNINQYTVQVIVGSTSSQQQTSYPCSAVETGTPIPADLASAWFPTLAFNLVQGTLELSGNVLATYAEPIEQVRSLIVLSNSSVSGFSSRVLSTPIQVAAGQRIYVKVVLSFS